MLTVRAAQLDAFAVRQVDAMRQRMVERVRQRYRDVCLALGSEETEGLVAACIAECLACGAANPATIVDAIDSLFQNGELPDTNRADALRSVRNELDARRLCSVLETLAGTTAV